jgi:hypothetical protein
MLIVGLLSLLAALLLGGIAYRGRYIRTH